MCSLAQLKLTNHWEAGFEWRQGIGNKSSFSASADAMKKCIIRRIQCENKQRVGTKPRLLQSIDKSVWKIDCIALLLHLSDNVALDKIKFTFHALKNDLNLKSILIDHFEMGESVHVSKLASQTLANVVCERNATIETFNFHIGSHCNEESDKRKLSGQIQFRAALNQADHQLVLQNQAATTKMLVGASGNVKDCAQ